MVLGGKDLHSCLAGTIVLEHMVPEHAVPEHVVLDNAAFDGILSGTLLEPLSKQVYPRGIPMRFDQCSVHQ